MARAGAALLAFVGGVVIALNWLRLERPQRDFATVLLLLVLAVLPSLAPRAWQRAALLLLAAVPTAAIAADAPLLRPWRAVPRLWNGFLEFYDIRLAFHPGFHPKMHAVLLIAAFGFTAALALAAVARRPLVAVLVLVIGAAWPATLLPDARDLTRGAVILGAALLLLAGLRRGRQPSLGRAALAGGVVLGAAVVAVTQPAVAKSEFLHWQTWDPYTRPTPPVGVRYVWNASYDGFSWPRKRTTVLRVKAPARSLYWRATTLDLFTGARWVENLTPARAQLFDGRLDLTDDDPLATAAARRPESWHKGEVEIESLAANHLVRPS